MGLLVYKYKASCISEITCLQITREDGIASPPCRRAHPGETSVKSLLRVKAVAKQWNSSIESTSFQERQFMHRQQSGDPDVLLVYVRRGTILKPVIESLRTLVVGSSSSVNIPTPWENILYSISSASCDGLVCLYRSKVSGFVVNPTTRWYRPLPLCQLQHLIIGLGYDYYKLNHANFKLGFGKDKFEGTYKPVWLYNSSEIGLDNATTCEVFDFTTIAWRYVTPSAPYRVVGCPDPVCIDGSLHWFTECQETKILSFDLHTEAFQIISKAPFANVENAYNIVMCNLDNRLCVSEMKWPNQLIWSFNSSNKTWHKFCSIDLEFTSQWFGRHHLCALSPLALFHENKKKLLFYSRESSEKTLVVLDLETKSYHVSFKTGGSLGYPVCYFQSLISIS